MEQFSTRAEIRTNILVLAGFSPDPANSILIIPEINVLMDIAAQKVMTHSRWISVRRQASLPLERKVDFLTWDAIETAYWMTQQYPTEYHPFTFGTSADPFVPSGLPVIRPVGPSGFVRAAIWAEKNRAFLPLRAGTCTPTMSYERWQNYGQERTLIDTEAGIDATTQAETQKTILQQFNEECNMPQIVEAQAGGLRFFPMPDDRYVIRVEYQISPTWGGYVGTMVEREIDQIKSSVDAIAIQHFTLADLFARQGDSANSARQEALAVKRMNELRGLQGTGERIRLNEDISFDDNETAVETIIPRWMTTGVTR